jgi:hypothetical protein
VSIELSNLPLEDVYDFVYFPIIGCGSCCIFLHIEVVIDWAFNCGAANLPAEELLRAGAHHSFTSASCGQSCQDITGISNGRMVDACEIEHRDTNLHFNNSNFPSTPPK